MWEHSHSHNSLKIEHNCVLYNLKDKSKTKQANMFQRYPIPNTTRIVFRRANQSHYEPSSHMMDYILHHINSALSDNSHFRKTQPSYHPYILRLYCAIIFWIQCLRAAHDAFSSRYKHIQFLHYFLDCHPIETLPIPGPLLPLFKTICSSQPEFSTYGKVCPRLPANPGPKRRDGFMNESVSSHMLPNVPGIFALLEHLNSLINADKPVYPKLRQHIPVNEAGAVFGHHSFPPHNERSDVEKWSLVSSGLQYPCEADQKLNERFAEQYGFFDFPSTAADDYLEELSAFLGMNKSVAWFNRVKEVAAAAARFFDGSGSLADCAASGFVANQVVVVLSPPAALPLAPTCSADQRSVCQYSFRLKSTARNLPPCAEDAAAYAQTHIRMFSGHPYYGDHGSKRAEHGPFWSIRPIESSFADDNSYLSISLIVRRMMKMKSYA